tara:strand:+ start:45 stop:773 length:729 start_codon:yes stop_codon:yes gene_type:complete
MKICIASFKRHETINDKTIGLLLNYGFLPEEIDLFVANKNEYELYKSVVPEGINIIIGKEGLKGVREFIFNYYDEGEYVLSIDDDIESIVDKDFNEVDNLKEIIDKGFYLCEKHSLKLWGLYPCRNKYFMDITSEITTDYKFIIGNFFGFINCKNMNQLNVTNIDDYERSIRSYILYGGSVRLNHYVCITNFKKNEGGAQCDIDRESKILNDMNILTEIYPNMIHLRKRKDRINPILKHQKI